MNLLLEELDPESFTELILTSKYHRNYQDIIESNKDRSVKKQRGFEIHHIIPRCFGGSDDPINLIKLTTKEHILIHYYLALMTNHIHMFHAFNYMIGNKFKKLSEMDQIELEELEKWSSIRDQSRKRGFSEKARKTIAEKARLRWEKWRQSGEIESIKQNISDATKVAMQTPEAQIKVRVNLGGKRYYNPETDTEIYWHEGDPILSHPWRPGRRGNSEESRKKVSKTLKGKKWYYNDELQINRTFGYDEKIPPGWKPGQPYKYRGNYTKLKKQKSIDILISLKEQEQEK